ncbi:MAG: MFS transporter [Candidatus Saccharibacteria bacterium]
MMNLTAYVKVLRNFNFTKLWISQVCSQLTNYLLSFVVLIKAFKLTQSSSSVAIIVISFGVAAVIFGSLAGVYSDRFDRRKLLTIVNFAQALAVAFYIPFGGNFWALALITFIYSSLNQFYMPAEAPSIPNLVSKDELLVANSFFSFTSSGSMIGGFILAGPVTLLFGSTGVYVLGMVLLLIAGIATLLLPSLKPEQGGEKDFISNVWKEFKQGIRHFWQSDTLHFPLISLVVAQIFNGMLITIAPAFIDKILKLPLEQGTYYMIAPLGVGILLGALLLGLENRYFSKPAMVLTGFFGMALAMGLLAAAAKWHFLGFYPVLAVLLGYFNAHIFAPSHSIIQQYAVDDVRGRIYGALYVLLQASATLPTVIIGLTADKLGIPTIMAAIAVVLVAVGWAIIPLKNRVFSPQLDKLG